MRFLLAEDDAEKARRVEEFLSSRYEGCSVVLVTSFGAVLDNLLADSANFDVLLLDMSMPAFESSSEEPDGGDPESFAGRDLLAQMRLRKIRVPTIVITMFDVFGEGRSKVLVGDLEKQLSQGFPGSFRGLVQYSQLKDSWKNDLERLIRKVTK